MDRCPDHPDAFIHRNADGFDFCGVENCEVTWWRGTDKRAPKIEHLHRLARQGCAEGNWIWPPLSPRHPPVKMTRRGLFFASVGALAVAITLWLG